MSINEEIEKLEKEYEEYKEADMNREASRIHTKIVKLRQKRDLLEWGSIKELQRKYNVVLGFIERKGMKLEFDNYVRALNENPKEPRWL